MFNPMITKDSANRKVAERRPYRFTRIILWVLVVVLAGALGYTLWVNRSLRNPETQTKLAEQASQEIIDSVARLIVVPEDKPTVATITDVEKLRESNSEFYKAARNGDTLLIYQTQAIIYRKEENKVIAVAPVVVNPGTPATTTDSSNATKEDKNSNAEEELENTTDTGNATE